MKFFWNFNQKQNVFCSNEICARFNPNNLVFQMQRQCDSMQCTVRLCIEWNDFECLFSIQIKFYRNTSSIYPKKKKNNICKTFEMNWNGLEVLFEQLNFVLNRTICSWSFAVFFQRKRRFWIISQSGNRKKANIRSSAIANSLRELPSINYKSLFLDVNSFSVRHSNWMQHYCVCVCLCAVDTRTWRFQRKYTKIAAIESKNMQHYWIIWCGKMAKCAIVQIVCALRISSWVWCFFFYIYWS